MASDDLRGIDWSWLSLDGCMTKAPFGGKKGHFSSNRDPLPDRSARGAGFGESRRLESALRQGCAKMNQPLPDRLSKPPRSLFFRQALETGTARRFLC